MTVNVHRLPLSKIREGTHVEMIKEPNRQYAGYFIGGVVKKRERKMILVHGNWYQKFLSMDGQLQEDLDVWVSLDERFSYYIIKNEGQEPVANEPWLLER